MKNDENKIYRVADVMAITGQNYSWCWRLVKQLKQEFHRENPHFKMNHCGIPKWYYEKVMCKKQENS